MIVVREERSHDTVIGHH